MKSLAPIAFAARLGTILAILALIAAPQGAQGLATEQFGPDKPERPTFPQPGWHKGIVEPLRHPSRVYSIWVNGNENFYFKATPDQVNELISQFSKARLRDHEIRLKAGTNTVKSLSGPVVEYNVSLQILDGIALFRQRELDSTETLEPVLTIYVGEDSSIVNQLKLPENVVVVSEVPGLNVGNRPAKPTRKSWFGRLEFDDATPAVDFQRSVNTRITFWDADSPEGIPLSSVTGDGSFRAVLSDAELADLKTGKKWLTSTTGNFLTEPKNSDERFPVELLADAKEKATAHQIKRPAFSYYGRILFEDGSPPILNPAPWPGAEISVNFPYAGRATLDAEGYFGVFLDPEQFAKLKERKPSRNIYLPLEEQGRGRAEASFPPELLSQDKAKAGVVKIPKPAYMAGAKQ